MTDVSGKKILLGITGGIAAYKAAELTRLFVKAGGDVRVVMTEAACRFITPVTLQALSGKEVFSEMWDPRVADNMGHIELSRDRDIIVVQGTNPGQPPVRLYFDESGRLVRLLHWRQTPVGAIPTRIDYSDYRPVGAIQMPFQWTRTWTNNQVVIQLKEIRPNVPIDAARFGRP